MKKIFLLLFASVLVFSCTKNVELADSSADLTSTISQYDATNLGVYKGVFTTQGTMERGVVEINVIPENYATATIQLVSGQTITFRSTQIIEEEMEILELKMIGAGLGETSFLLTADIDGSNVIISRVMFNGKKAGMIAAHDTSRAPVVPITGVLACDDCAAHPLLVTGDTGTFSLLYVGDGSADDTVTALADVGVIVSTSGGQSGCVDGGAQTTCDITGGDLIGTNDIAWIGTHTYDNVGDCSEAAGTWSLDSGNHGSYAGTFTSDVTCVPGAPANDTCATAEAAVCGGSYTGSTVTATDDDGAYGPDVWYSLTGLVAGTEVTVSLCGGLTTYDSRLVIYDACGGSEIATNDDSCGLQSEIIYITDGSDVLVSVQAFSTGTGNYGLDITCAAAPTCNDGIQNGDETGIDCGGATCPACPPAPLTCGDVYVDDGGTGGDYSIDITESTLVDATAGLTASVGFTAFDIEATWDFMYFYDGATSGDPQIMASDLGVPVSADRNGGSGFTGTDLLGDSVTATGQFMTVVFISDASVPFPGWEGNVSCLAPAPLQENSVKFTATPRELKAATQGDIIARKKLIRSLQNK
ncbi:hypothetical protein ABXT64_01820 [Candidatus Marifrigoribacter sp. Uisw_064]|jgi:hypothetical protein|uniref:hypothetical protein n=1 Tax=Candidatus Marifrigoribacter sp. Uisw_064 TaxID=3230970 RepID=UPI003D4E4315